MTSELQPTDHLGQDLHHENGGFDLLAEAIRLDLSVRASFGLDRIQGDEKLKQRLAREVSIGLILGARELNIEIPKIAVEEQAKNDKPHIASADWNPERGGNIIFVLKYPRKFINGTYEDLPFYYVVTHEMFHIKQMMTDMAQVRADMKARNWKQTLTEKTADSFMRTAAFSHTHEILEALQGLPSPSPQARAMARRFDLISN